MKIRKEFHAYLLFPLALFYWGLIYWRNLFYKYGFFVSRRLPCVVISIGNITVGGTGKTPMVIHLAQYLQSIGKHVAILSRGYGRNTTGTVFVSDGNTILRSWEESGDEPYLMAKKCPTVPIVVDEDRYRGGLFLMEQCSPDVVLLDDGFQHRAIERDLDLVLINSNESKYDHKLLPYGMLREPWQNIHRSNALILTKTNLNRAAPFLKRKLKESKQPIFQSTIDISQSSMSPTVLSSLENTSCFLFSAIGDANSFSTGIKSLGCKIVAEQHFPDHFHYSESSLNKLNQSLFNSDADVGITTEKDWVKIESYSFDKPIVVVGIEVGITPMNKFTSFLKTATQAIQ